MSRGSAGSRTLVIMMRDLGYRIGRFKVRSLMQDAMVVSKQSKVRVYKQTGFERLDIPNISTGHLMLMPPTGFGAVISPIFGQMVAGII